MSPRIPQLTLGVWAGSFTQNLHLIFDSHISVVCPADFPCSRHSTPCPAAKGSCVGAALKECSWSTKHSNIIAVLPSHVSVQQEPSTQHLDCQTFSLWFYTFSRSCRSFQSLSQRCKTLAVTLRAERRINFPLNPWFKKQKQNKRKQNPLRK